MHSRKVTGIDHKQGASLVRRSERARFPMGPPTLPDVRCPMDEPGAPPRGYGTANAGHFELETEGSVTELRGCDPVPRGMGCRRD